jgi:aspartate aminotransferase-like enzyme
MAILLTPGPCPVPSFVAEAIAMPVMPHRTAGFEAFFGEMKEGLRYLFQTEAHVCGMMGSGTMGVEAAMYSLFKEGDAVLVPDFGKFSRRWVDYGKLMGLNLSTLTKKWGEEPSVVEFLEKAQNIPDLKGVVLTHCETSTGVAIDLEEMAFVLRRALPEVLLLVDAVSSVGAIPFYFDAWDLDCAVVASQKALMNPAGTVYVAFSERGRRAVRQTHPSDGRNLWNYLDFADRNSFPYTPPVQLFYGIMAALGHIRGAGLPAVWNRTHSSAKTFREMLLKAGGVIFGTGTGESLTAFSIPGTEAGDLRAQLKEKGFLLSGGQGELKGKILRVSHMGPVCGVEAMIRLRAAIHT